MDAQIPIGHVPTGDAPAVGLSPELFAAAFPFHFAVGRDLRLIQAGRSLLRVVPEAVSGAAFHDLFRILRPEGCPSFDFLHDNRSQLFLLEHLGTSMKLRGEFVTLPNGPWLVFLGSPWLQSAAEISERGLSFDDFATHDPIVDLLQLAQAQVMALEDSRRLTERLVAQRSDLRRANEQLQEQNRVLQDTETQLRRSEAEARKLALVAARTDNSVIVTDAQGRVEWVNDGFVRSTGYSLEEMRGRTPGSVLQGPRTDPQTVTLMRENLRNGSGFRTEVLNYTKSGRPYWVSIEVQPVQDASGRVTNFMAIESDVTERRQNEQRRQFQHAVSRAITESSSMHEGLGRAVRAITQGLGWAWGAFWRPISPEGRLRFEDVWHDPSNDLSGFCETTRSQDLEPGMELPGRCWSKAGMVWLKDVGRDLDTARAREAGRAGFHAALAHPCVADGKIVGILELYAFHGDALEEDLIEGLDAVCSQIGLFVVREQAEIAARRAGALQQAMFNSAAHALTAVTPEGVYLSFNPAAERLLGYRADEVIGRETPLLIHDPRELAERAAELENELGHPVEAGIESLLARARMGFKDDRDWTLIRRDGSRVPVRLSITELRDDAGTLTGFLGSAVDLTDRRQAEAAMRDAKEAAEAANRAKSEFLATMSHEIRTPMNGVIGMTDLLQQTPLTDRQRELTESIGNSAAALLDVINDVLDFSRVEAGKLNISSETFVLRPLVDAVLEVASMRAPEKQLTLAAVIQPELPRRFRGDPVRLRQILLNLVGNGVKFTERGHVVVRVSTPSDANRR
ncbi:MAG: PAS domain S-box protein, partial [Verrucomicrobiales bacterium]|nr:PAS domain S-box protein [Verrucomicrobiales bacterium]